MVKFENVQVVGWDAAIRGMRNPLESWDKTDSYWTYVEDAETLETAPYEFFMGENDHELAMKLAASGASHSKFRRMIVVYVDITAPLYWWKEFDTYKVGTVANSCSTMHKIHVHEFTPDMFSTEHLFTAEMVKEMGIDEDLHAVNGLSCVTVEGFECFFSPDEFVHMTCNVLNRFRDLYLEETDPKMKKQYWWQMIQLLPSSYNQKRTIMLNYEVLANIYRDRAGHKQDEWSQGFMEFIESLPYSELITLKTEEE